MGDLPEGSNLYGTLHTNLKREDVAALFAASGWSARKWGFAGFELSSPFGELVLESDTPLLLHGPVADVLANVVRIAEILRGAEITFVLECYDDDGALLNELKYEGKAV